MSRLKAAPGRCCDFNRQKVRQGAFCAQRAIACLLAISALTLPTLAQQQKPPTTAYLSNFINNYLPKTDGYCLHIKGQVQETPCGEPGCIEPGTFVYVTNVQGDVAAMQSGTQGMRKHRL